MKLFWGVQSYSSDLLSENMRSFLYSLYPSLNLFLDPKLVNSSTQLRLKYVNYPESVSYSPELFEHLNSISDIRASYEITLSAREAATVISSSSHSSGMGGSSLGRVGGEGEGSFRGELFWRKVVWVGMSSKKLRSRMGP